MPWTYRDTIPGVSSGGPNPQDAFSIKLGMTDLNALPADATSFAFGFPESIVTAADAVSLSLLVADTNPALSDALMRLAITMTETNASQSETLTLGISMADAISAMTDAVSIAMGLADTNAALSDALLRLAITIADSNAVPTDAVSYIMNLLQGDSNATPTDGYTIGGMRFTETPNAVPAETRNGLAYFWLSGTTAAAANAANPNNLNGPNDGVTGIAKTIAAGATTAQYTSNVGSGIPNGIPISTAIYRGWFSTGTGVNSTKTLVLRSSTGLFADITAMTTGTSVNFLDGSFTFDLIAAGINTLAKLQSLQIIHKVVDAVAGSGGNFGVDAGRVELNAII